MFDFGADCARPQARSRISMHHAAIDYVGVFFISTMFVMM
jgi:hypothetical protein